jgi:hypothetical protein
MTAVSSLSSSLGLTFWVGTAVKSVILGMYKSFALKIPSNQLGVGLTQLGNRGQSRPRTAGVAVGVSEKKDIGKYCSLTVDVGPNIWLALLECGGMKVLVEYVVFAKGPRSVVVREDELTFDVRSVVLPELAWEGKRTTNDAVSVVVVMMVLDGPINES